jgi:sirohydrochlorin cobaltochelatase
MFLGAGGHVRKDLPRLLVAAVQAAHPGMQVTLHPPVGELGPSVAVGHGRRRRGHLLEPQR